MSESWKSIFRTTVIKFVSCVLSPDVFVDIFMVVETGCYSQTSVSQVSIIYSPFSFQVSRQIFLLVCSYLFFLYFYSGFLLLSSPNCFVFSIYWMYWIHGRYFISSMSIDPYVSNIMICVPYILKSTLTFPWLAPSF